jgi:hypothetical protein
MAANAGGIPSLHFSRKRCSRCRRRRAFLQEAAMVAAGTMEKKMRVFSQSELLSLSRVELMGLLRRIASELATLPEGLYELR